MRLILTTDLANLGKAGQTVDVAAGYGRNYLIPRGFAIVASPQNERNLVQQQRARAAREAKTKADAQVLASHVESISLSIARKTGASEQLYGSVTSQDIAALLKERGVTLDRRKIDLESPLKTLGMHKVPIRLHPEVVAEVEVTVVKE